MAIQSEPSWAYYHSLYHLTAHWGACVGILMLLLTIGLYVGTHFCTPCLLNIFV